MSKVVIGVFDEHDAAESAIRELKSQGFDREISMVARDSEETGGGMGGQDLTTGTVTGGTLGGLAGLLAGAGALLIPGIGPIVAAGPLAAGLTGVVTGGVAGGLIDYGIPEARGEYYEDQLRRGSILVTLKSSAEKVDLAASILRNNGAQDVETHG
ncbi:MAG TPA: hypothetical protein GX693_02785 [Firmicutes bacterium]|nr:hypothetical protein [Bacillota bacterium]